MLTSWICLICSDREYFWIASQENPRFVSLQWTNWTFPYALTRQGVQYLAISPAGVMLVSSSCRLQGLSDFVKTIKHGVLAIILQVTLYFKKISWTVNCHSLIILFCSPVLISSGDLLIHRTQADKKSWAKPDAFQQSVFSFMFLLGINSLIQTSRWEKGQSLGDENIAAENLRRFFEQHFHENNDSWVSLFQPPQSFNA
jgi:hypothetical protein